MSNNEVVNKIFHIVLFLSICSSSATLCTSQAMADVCFLPYGECDTGVIPGGNENCEGYADSDKSMLPGWTCDKCENDTGVHFKCTQTVCDEKFTSEQKTGEGWEECETCNSGDEILYYCPPKACPEGSSTTNESNQCMMYSITGYSGEEPCYGNGEDKHICSGTTERKEGDGWSCTTCVECDGVSYYDCKMDQCSGGYKIISEVGCDTDNGYHYSYNGYSGGEACVKCMADSCPKGYSNTPKPCDEDNGYIWETSGKSAGKDCTRCVEKGCPTGFDTSTTSCEAGWEIEVSGISGGKECKKCTQMQCEINYTSSIFGKDNDSNVILNFASIRQEMLPMGVFVEPVYEDFFTASRVYVSSMTKQQWLAGGNIRLPLKRDHDFTWSKFKIGNETYNGMNNGGNSGEGLSSSVSGLKEQIETLLDDVTYLDIKYSGAEVLSTSGSPTFGDADYIWIKRYDHKYDGHCTLEGGKFSGQAVVGLYFRECERGYRTDLNSCESGATLTTSMASQSICKTCKVSCPKGYGISPYAYDEGMISDHVCLNGVDFEEVINVGNYSCYKCR